MSYFTIKLYAMAFMLIDHIGFMLLDNNSSMRLLGRIAFPLFCFLLVNGFYHTTNKYKYLLRMILFAIFSEAIYDWVKFGQYFEFSKQNIFFTLSVGLLSIIVIEKSKEYVDKRFFALVQMIIMVASIILNELINADYGWYGIVLILGLYLTYGTTEQNKINMAMTIVGVNVLKLIIDKNVFQTFSVLAIAYIFTFKEQKVNVPKWAKLCCYIFYPAHLLVLGLIKFIL